MPAPAATPSLDEGAPRTLTFDERAVPCTPDALSWVLSPLLAHADTRRPDDVTALRAIADPLRGLGADDLHRQLLAARRTVARTAPWLRHDVAAALAVVRRHSRLYSRRHCPCLFAAWQAFVADVDRQLTGTDGMWAVSTAGQPQHDAGGPLRGADLGRCSNTGMWDRPARVPLQVTRTAGPTPRVEVFAGRRATTLTLLTARQSRAAHLVRWSGEAATPAAGSWVLSWPAELLDVVLALAGNPGRTAPCADEAAALLAAGFADLPPEALGIATRLATGWTGSAEALVTAATEIAHAAA